jgi:hypothetical protein
MRGSVLSPGALFAGGALAVHELRHALAHGSPVDDGHGYLALLAPLVGLALALACLQFAVRLIRRRPPGRLTTRGPLARWLLVSGALLAVYVCQEVVEGVITAHGPAGVFGHGGWVAVGLALAVGAGVGALLRGAEAALARRASRGFLRAPTGPLRLWQPREAPIFRFQVLARHLAGRAPPSPVLR